MPGGTRIGLINYPKPRKHMGYNHTSRKLWFGSGANCLNLRARMLPEPAVAQAPHNFCHLFGAAISMQYQLGPSGLGRDVLAVHRLDLLPELLQHRVGLATALRDIPGHTPLQPTAHRNLQEDSKVEEKPQFTAMQQP
jgi:hypothetical protein